MDAEAPRPQLTLDIAKSSVMIGMPCGFPYVPRETALALADTTAALSRQQIPFQVYMPSSISIVHWVRCIIAQRFLESSYEVLFWIDSDIAWTPDQFLRILALSARMPCVGASYPQKSDDPKSAVFGLTPTPNEYGCLPIEAMGLGFTATRREVIETLAASQPVRQLGNRPAVMIFRSESEPAPGRSGPAGEDVGFFRDVKRVGYQPFLEPSVILGHVGTKVYRVEPLSTIDHSSSTDI